MYKKFSNRLSGGMADSWHGTPFRHHHAVEFHRTRGENRASSMQSEKSRKSHGKFIKINFIITFARLKRKKMKSTSCDSQLLSSIIRVCLYLFIVFYNILVF